jgi:hypothetical protein
MCNVKITYMLQQILSQISNKGGCDNAERNAKCRQNLFWQR